MTILIFSWQDEFKIEEVSKLMEYNRKNQTKNELHLRLGYMNGRYEVRKQYPLYDINSFIADVGGYLGLLLGGSILGLCSGVEKWIVSKSKKSTIINK